MESRIHDAAARLVARLGPDGFTMADLARESGVARATLYRQVRSREAVLAALTARGVELGERLDVPERILLAARTVFGRAGFDAATLEDIAREAQVGAATVYRQFKDKDGLIRAFVERFSPRRAVRDVSVSPSEDLRADLERVARAFLDVAAGQRDLIRLTLLERLRGGQWAELLRSSPTSSLRSVTRLLKHHADRGRLRSGDANRMATAFAGLLFSTVMGALVDGQPVRDVDEAVAFVTEAFLEGFSAPTRRRR